MKQYNSSNIKRVLGKSHGWRSRGVTKPVSLRTQVRECRRRSVGVRLGSYNTHRSRLAYICSGKFVSSCFKGITLFRFVTLFMQLIECSLTVADSSAVIYLYSCSDIFTWTHVFLWAVSQDNPYSTTLCLCSYMYRVLSY